MNKNFILLCSFLICKYIAKNFKSIYFGNYHIHHWMWALFGFLICTYFDFKIIKLIFLGILFEGLSYDDWYKI